MDTKPRILIVDDDRDIAEVIRIYLAAEGYPTAIAYDGAAALQALDEHPDIGLVLLDIMMPRMDGVSATLRIRERRNIPILMVTAKSEDADIVLGLGVGADDYITKPFSPVELLARVKSALRRYTQLGGAAPVPETTLAVGGLEMDTLSRTVTVDGSEVRLTATEYKILEYFLRNVGRVLTVDEIYSAVWQEAPVGADNTVAVHIRRIREKTEIDPGRPRYIKVVWGVGYCIKEEKPHG